MNNYAEEYITKATAQEVVKDVFRIDTITQEVIDTCMKCMIAIKNAPSANVRENVRGEWVKVKDDVSFHYECSVCRAKPLYEEFCHQPELSDFCPNCGAKMKNEE